MMQQNSTVSSPLHAGKGNRYPSHYLKQRWLHFLQPAADGTLLIEGNSILDIEKKFGSPCYLLIEREIRERLQKFKQAFPYEKFRPQYACKVNSNLEIIRMAKEEGFDLDASSVGEIILGLLAGFKPEQITFTNPHKTYQDIAFSAMIGIQAITTDSIEELQKISMVAEKLDLDISIFLRINPLITHGAYSTHKQQHGIPLPQAREAVTRVIQHSKLTLKGLHFHGSYISDPIIYEIAAEKLLDLAKHAAELGTTVEFLDLGGGFPTYDNSHPGYCENYDVAKAGKKIVGFIKNRCKELGLQEPTLVFEPGKLIVANAMLAVMKVVSVKDNGEEKIIITNGSVYNLVPDRLISKLDYSIVPANKLQEPASTSYRVTGCTCDSLDFFGNSSLPEMKQGDLLTVMDCGAYCSVFASNFNSLKRVPMVLVKEDGSLKLIRRRDRYAEMFAPELDANKAADPKELQYFYNLHRINFEKIWGENLTPKVREERLEKPLKAVLRYINQKR